MGKKEWTRPVRLLEPVYSPRREHTHLRRTHIDFFQLTREEDRYRYAREVAAFANYEQTPAVIIESS